jgi:hypothetical protein
MLTGRSDNAQTFEMNAFYQVWAFDVQTSNDPNVPHHILLFFFV